MTIATTALTPDLPEEPEDEEFEDDEEFEVGVMFYADDFGLMVRWATSTSADDEARVLGAAGWFAETYGFDPGQYATHTAVNRIPGQ